MSRRLPARDAPIDGRGAAGDADDSSPSARRGKRDASMSPTPSKCSRSLGRRSPLCPCGSDCRSEDPGRHVWKMCTSCESEPEPNHPGMAGTRALGLPGAHAPRRIWPTVDWPDPGAWILGAASRPARARGAPGRPALRDGVPGRRPRPFPPWADSDRSPGTRRALGRCVAKARRSLPGACAPVSGPSRCADPRGFSLRDGRCDRVTLADNAPHRNPNGNQPFRLPAACARGPGPTLAGPCACGPRAGPTGARSGDAAAVERDRRTWPLPPAADLPGRSSALAPGE